MIDPVEGNENSVILTEQGKNSYLGELQKKYQKSLQEAYKFTTLANGALHPEQLPKDSPEYQRIKDDLSRGETPEKASARYRVRAESDRLQALDAELPFRQAQIEQFKKDGVPPASDDELMVAIQGFRPGGAVNLTFLNLYLAERFRLDGSLDKLKVEAQLRINKVGRDQRKLEAAVAIKNGQPDAGSLPGFEQAKYFLEKGWNIDDVIRNLEGSISENTKGSRYKQAVERLDKIPVEKQQTVDDHKKAIEKFYELNGSQPNKQLEGVISFEDAKQNSSEIPFKEFHYRGVPEGWLPDPAGEACPDFNEHDPRLIAADVVDLHKLPVGTLLNWSGSHPAAYYFMRIEPGGKVKAWRGGREEEVSGLMGNIDDIKMDDIKHVNTNNLVTEFTGVLISKEVPDVLASANMPYFDYDTNGVAKKPNSIWLDGVNKVYLIPPK